MSPKNWIRSEGRTYSIAPGERALDAMLRQGAPVAFSCRKGSCRSCMLQATSGNPGVAATDPLPQEYRDLGLFLPCCATDVDSVEAVRPDLSHCIEAAVVAHAERVAPDILRLQLEPLRALSWSPGQIIGLINPEGAVRSYSVVSHQTDYFLEINLRIYPQGAVSGWAASLQPGDRALLLWQDQLPDQAPCQHGLCQPRCLIAAPVRWRSADHRRPGHHDGVQWLGESGPLRGLRSRNILLLPGLRHPDVPAPCATFGDGRHDLDLGRNARLHPGPAPRG
jgi:ferredoxin